MDRPKVGVGVIIKRDSKIILQKRTGVHGADTWCFPGGHLEFNETIEECAKREAKEEANVNIKNIKIIGFTNDGKNESGSHYITIFVTSDYESGKIKLNEPESAKEIRLVDPDNMPEPLFLPVKNLVNGINFYPNENKEMDWKKKAGL